ncbi:MAG: protease complex subunit PrcB family protein [Thermincola sp.]|nr:protease complex subunit PrcB family protein [Thermincola sp.]MDT3704886.1 protease complex subunit PrcB family protein [Thermincola sp.]
MKSFEPKTNKIMFESLGINRAPEGLQALIEGNKSAENAMLVEDQGNYWVFLARGLKPTGGYAVKVTEIKSEPIDGGKLRLKVFYKKSDPAPGQFVTQVMTCPTDLVLIKGLKKKPDDVIYILAE